MVRSRDGSSMMEEVELKRQRRLKRMKIRAERRKQKKNQQQQTNSYEWPKHSYKSLPSLPSMAITAIEERNCQFVTNEECTSITLPPSGRHVIAGFCDGTLRLYDVTGRLLKNTNNHHDNHHNDDDVNDIRLFGDTQSSSESEMEEEEDPEMKELFDCDSSDEEDKTVKKKKKKKKKKKRKKMYQKKQPKKKKMKRNQIVMSKCHQNYGAVACQIQAKGVITSLLMDVVCAQDSLFCFGGVLRGSTELVAVDLSGVERYHDEMEHSHPSRRNSTHDILDMIKVHRYSDAKLKGFGACTRLQNCHNTRQEYRLFTGKGIKNIHIWSFVPPQVGVSEPIWQCLYDTPTNGNTITQLSFRHDSNGLLQGISKSDDQKLRIWDLSFEQGLHHTKKSVISQLAKRTQIELSSKSTTTNRPKRPPYIDVMNTENTLGVFGPYTFSGGVGMVNQMSVMCLDVEDVQSPFNHTELAFPGENNDNADEGRRSSRSKRQQRGELKSIMSVTGLTQDAAHVILELSNGSVCHYSQNEKKLDILDPSLYVSKQNVEENASAQSARKMCITRVGAQGTVVVATTFYDNGKGFIILRSLPSSCNNHKNKPIKGFWGFHGLSFPPLKCLATPSSSSSQSEDSSSSNNNVIATMSSPDHTPAMSKTVSSPPSTKNEARIVVASSPDSNNTPDNENTNDFPSTPPHKSSLPFHKNETSYAPTGVAVSPERVDTSPPKETTSKTIRDQETPINGTIMKFLTKTNVENKKTKKSSTTPSENENTATNYSKSNLTEGRKKHHKEPNEANGKHLPSQQDTTNAIAKAKLSERPTPSKDKNDISFMSKSTNMSIPETDLQKPKQNPSLRIQVTKRKINAVTNSVSVEKEMVRSEPKKQSGMSTQEDPPKQKKINKVEKSSTENSTLRKTDIQSGKVIESSKQAEQKTSLSISESDGSNNVVTKFNENLSESKGKMAGCQKEKKKRKKILTGSLTNIPNGSNAESVASKKAKSQSSISSIDFDKPSSEKKDGNTAQSDTKVVENQKKKMKRIDHITVEPDRVKKTDNRTESNSSFKSSSSKNDTKNTNESTKVGNKDGSVFPSSHENYFEAQTLDNKLSSKKNDSLNEESKILRVATALVNLQNDDEKRSLKKKPKKTVAPPRTPERTGPLHKHTNAPKKFRMKKKASLSDLLYLKNLRPNFTDIIRYSCEISSYESNSPAKQSSVQTREDLIKLQDAARRKMSLHHRSAHEQIRRKVLSCADRVVNMYPNFDISTPSPSIEAAKVWLNESIWTHEQSLKDLLDIQKMEAASLAACQTAEAGGKKAPVVQVSFPFPRVFSQARQTAFKFLEECATKI